MASTPTERVADQSSPPSLEELARRSARTILLPFIIGYSSSAAPSDRPREIAIIVNPRTGSLTVIEGSVDVESLLLGKEGRVPASKASIEAMPLVKVAEGGLDCAICLAELEVGEEAKQMPCKHHYHAGCIDKWLGIQGSCPVCRYRMPVEQDEKINNGEGGGDDSDGEAEDDGEEEEEQEEGGSGMNGRMPAFVFHIYFAPRRRSNQDSGGAIEADDDNSASTGDVDGSSTEDMEVDGRTSSPEMDIDQSTS